MSITRVVLQFALLGLVVLVVVSVGSAAVSRRVATKAAIDDARRATYVYANGIVRPIMPDALLTMDPEAVARIDVPVKAYVISSSLFRVKIWRQDGTIIYSDQDALIGKRYVLSSDEVNAFNEGKVIAEVSSASAAENTFEAGRGNVLEVYLPLNMQNGTPVLFETYYRYDLVKAAGKQLWLNFSPVTLGSLLLLEVVQIPLALSLARRLKRGQRQRERLLQHAIDSSEQERRRVAGDLHDGVVQDLTGVSLQLSAAGMRREGVAHTELDVVTADAAHRLRDSIRSLRALLVDIYPPNLYDEGLDVVLSDLATRLSNRGIDIHVDVVLPESLPREVTGLLYRGAQEALRNVLAHAEASEVTVTARADDDMAMLVVRDDGRGFAPDSIADRPREGHVGLRVLADLAAEAGGTLRVESSPGLGTRVRLGVPIR